MEDSRIKEWAKLLLDLGKRNNLINFKDSKKTSAEIVAPDSEKVFSRAQGEASFEVYDPKLKFDEMTEMVVDDKISREEYIRTYSESIKSDKQLLLYNPTSPIFAAKEIGKKARSAIEETGVNIAHLAFGFVHWKESDDSEYVYRAPLLLIPITLSEASKVEPIYIKTLGEDVVVNPTLSYKLSAEYGFELPEYNEQSFEEYVAAVRTLVAPLKWKVTDDCKIGLFSFLKINMYYDLIKNTENIESSQIIKALLNQEGDSEGASDGSGEESKRENPIIELHNVIDADSSQIEAIEMAKSGKSFVLQGPPGTGKSQTITNIITECLHDGKKVLFVSEKQAALNVVYDKLKKAGLEDFCLELHSYKANKKDFINNINDALSSTRSHLSRSALMEVEKKKKLMEELDLYESELHKIRPIINESLYAMYDGFSSCRDLDGETSFVIDEIEKKGKDYLEKAEDLLNTYSGFTDAIGYNYTNNPWYGYVDRDTSYRKMEEVERKFMTLAGMISDFEDTRKEIEKEYDLRCNTINDLKSWKTFFNVASKSDFMTPTFLENAAFAYTYEKLGFLKEHGEKIVALRGKITKNYDAEIMNIQSADYQKILERQYSSFFSRLFSSEYKLIIKEIRLQNKQGQKESYQGAIDLLKDINTYKQLYSEFEEKEALVKGGFGSSYNGVDTDWAKLMADFECLKGLYAKGASFGSISGLTKESYETNKKNFEGYENSIGDFINHCEELCESVSRGFDSSLFNIYTTDLDEIIKKLSSCVDDMDGLENWIHFLNLMDEIKSYGIKEFVDAAIASNVPAKDVAKSFKKTFYHQWIETIIRSTPTLSRFNYVEHNKALQEFKNKDLEHFTINMAEIRSELYGKRPLTDVVPANSPIAIIRREAQKKRKQKSIRVLLSETGELVQTLKPCFLMSPLSVSTFLDTDKIRFDTVVFDEASQIFPQDAIGAIYRGSQLIVVGDSKQMPPSNFFSTTIESEDDEEEEINDYESILDLCSTKFNQLLLKWHYRSKYEELIAFSNRNYYKNELVTFPSSISANMMDVGVDFYKVDGVYDRTSRTNRVEAEKVVDLVFEHFKKHPQRSLGVVAFNISQQSLIEKLISKRREKDSSADEFFKGDLKEPFFVKNLETVQGDERDTIIFSVAYAKDTTGRFISNFGPLNKVGGERRLNVAVTRAKKNVKLVTSMYYTDIPVTENVGAKNLRDYLDFAQNGAVALERSISVDAFDHYDSDFEMEVCEFLRSKGFTVDTQVGCSSFKIDMAIRKPDTSDYVLAVECDGASYHSSKNARDRDRLRQQVLESMGWQFYRIWSTDWFRNKENAKIKLLEAASAAVGISKKPVFVKKEEPQTSPEDFEYQREEHLEFPKYQMANVDSIFRRNRYSFIKSLAEILKVEAPLSEEWLLKRTCKFFDREKVTSYVTDQYEYNMRNAGAYGITRRNGFLYLSGNNSYTMRVPDGDFKRDFNYIAYEELAAGMYYIIKNSVTVDKDALYLATVKVLGFAKVTDNFRQRLDKALSILSKNSVDVDGDIIKIRQS